MDLAQRLPSAYTTLLYGNQGISLWILELFKIVNQMNNKIKRIVPVKSYP